MNIIFTVIKSVFPIWLAVFSILLFLTFAFGSGNIWAAFQLSGIVVSVATIFVLVEKWISDR